MDTTNVKIETNDRMWRLLDDFRRQCANIKIYMTNGRMVEGIIDEVRSVVIVKRTDGKTSFIDIAHITEVEV